MQPFCKDSDGVFRCPELEAFPWLKHGFGSRHAARIGSVVTLRQIHSNVVCNALALTDRSSEGDALITNQAGNRVGVRTADCVPILMVDPVTRSVAAIHAGWRGTVALIAGRAVEKLTHDFGSRPADLHVAFGPAIRVCCYEVGPEVLAQFVSIFPEMQAASELKPNPERFGHLDLVEANRRVLLSAGVPGGNIYDSGLCTFCVPEEFYSYRREPKEPGRLLSFVEIVTNALRSSSENTTGACATW